MNDIITVGIVLLSFLVLFIAKNFKTYYKYKINQILNETKKEAKNRENT